MMLHYEILTEEQAMQERFQLLPAGEYDAIISKSEDKVSSNSGNPMMDMTLTVYDKEGREHSVRDFLVFTKSMMWKAIHFAESAGIIDSYKAGRLCSLAAQGKNVKVKIGIEEGRLIPEDKLQDKPPGSKYPDKNKVEDYVKRTSQSSFNPNVTGMNHAGTDYHLKQMQEPPPHDDDNVPF